MIDEVKHTDVTQLVIKAFLTVYNSLGIGFHEKVYHPAMVLELRELGLTVMSEHPINVFYRGMLVGEFFADLVVNNCVIVELKAGREIHSEHRSQLFNYLKASRFEVGLLMNFGKEPKYERKLFNNEGKGTLAWIKPIAPTNA